MFASFNDSTFPRSLKRARLSQEKDVRESLTILNKKLNDVIINLMLEMDIMHATGALLKWIMELCTGFEKLSWNKRTKRKINKTDKNGNKSCAQHDSASSEEDGMMTTRLKKCIINARDLSCRQKWDDFQFAILILKGSTLPFSILRIVQKLSLS